MVRTAVGLYPSVGGVFDDGTDPSDPCGLIVCLLVMQTIEAFFKCHRDGAGDALTRLGGQPAAPGVRPPRS